MSLQGWKVVATYRMQKDMIVEDDDYGYGWEYGYPDYQKGRLLAYNIHRYDSTILGGMTAFIIWYCLPGSRRISPLQNVL